MNQKSITSTINKIDKIIKQHGIPKYIKEWKPLPIPKNFTTYYDFIMFLINYVHSYHSHSTIHSRQLIENANKNIDTTDTTDTEILQDRPMPTFNFDNTNNIGTITYYHFYNTFDTTATEKDAQKLIKLVTNQLNTWNKLGLNGLIIDLKEHFGGNMFPGIYSLAPILGKTTLLSFNNTKTNFNDKKWLNLIGSNKIAFNQPFLTDKLSFSGPIAIIVSKNTSSSGEIIASIFTGRSNCKIFGHNTNKTRGDLSVNNSFRVTGDIMIHLTVSLITTVDGVFQKQEHVIVNQNSANPINNAKKWIISKNK